MSSKVKKIILVSLFFVLLLIILIAKSLGEPPKKPEEIAKTEPPIIQKSQGNLPVNIKKEVNPDIPESVPSITFRYKRLNRDLAKQMASNFGFNEEPTTLNDVIDGTIFVWGSPTTEYSLSITPQYANISYHMIELPRITPGTKLSEDQIENFAVSFINKYNINKDEVTLTSLRYLRIADDPDAGFIEGTKNNARLIQANFTYKAVNYPVLTNIPQFQIIYVQLLPDGRIYKSEAYLLENFNQSKESLKVKNMEQIKNSLPDAKLISLENDFIEAEDVDRESLQKIEIDKIETGYLFDKSSNVRTLYPVFMLSGTVNIKDSTASYAHLYLPALQ